jgi:hypothetical protein
MMNSLVTFSELSEDLCFVGKMHLLRKTKQSFHLDDLFAQYVSFLLTNQRPTMELSAFNLEIDVLITIGALVEVGGGVVHFSEQAAAVEGLEGSELAGSPESSI